MKDYTNGHAINLNSCNILNKSIPIHNYVIYCTIVYYTSYKLQMKLKMNTYKVITMELFGILNYLLCIPMDM